MQNSHSNLLWNISLCEPQVWSVKNCWQLKRNATWVTALACRSGLLCKILSTSDCRGYMKVAEYKEFLFVFCLAVLQITHLSVTTFTKGFWGDSAVFVLWFFWPCIWHTDVPFPSGISHKWGIEKLVSYWLRRLHQIYIFEGRHSFSAIRGN